MALASGALAQGLVNFGNTSVTLVSVMWSVIPSGQGGAYNFALLAAPSGTTDYRAFAFTGIQGTNLNSAAGRFTGGVNLPANNWAAGETKAYYVVGWSANGGAVFDPAWLAPGWVHTDYGDFRGPSVGFFGVSGIGVGAAGGGGFPNLFPFGGASGIPAGFNLVIPEPATLALAGLGTLALVIANCQARRRRMKAAQAAGGTRRLTQYV